MPVSIMRRIPVVGGLAYEERVRRLPSSFEVSLAVEPGNRYFLEAIAVLVNGEKVGYVAPEVARRYFEPLSAHEGQATCLGRTAAPSDRSTSGVEILLDFTRLPVRPLE
ncbi:MAG TPA: hypothetical protein VLD67_03275 [Vicinamibacterales bacterium]|nr:hypothetical protein [Vicinamibacterales bacterium]